MPRRARALGKKGRQAGWVGMLESGWEGEWCRTEEEGPRGSGVGAVGVSSVTSLPGV